MSHSKVINSSAHVDEDPTEPCILTRHCTVLLRRIKIKCNAISSPKICSSPSGNEAIDEITPIISTQNDSFEANAPHNHLTEEILCETPNDDFAGKPFFNYHPIAHTLKQKQNLLM